MKRLVIIGKTPACIKAGAIVKRLQPEIEVNLVDDGTPPFYPADTLSHLLSGKYKSLSDPNVIDEIGADVKEADLKTMGIKLINAALSEIDFEERLLILTSSKGSLRLPFTTLIADVRADRTWPEPFETAPNVFLWPDASRVDEILTLIENNPRGKACVIGAGLEGYMAAGALAQRGMETVWVKTGRKEDGENPASLDKDMEFYADSKATFDIIKADGDMAIERDDSGILVSLRLQDATVVESDIFLVIGRVSPPLGAAEELGLVLDKNGLVKIGRYFQTSIPFVFAIGNGISVPRFFDGEPFSPPREELLTTMARFLSRRVIEKEIPWPGSPSVYKARAEGVHIEKIGLGMLEAVKAGYEPEFCIVGHSTGKNDDRREVIAKLICDKKRRNLLGVQIVGTPDSGDLYAAAITVLTSKMKLTDILTLDYDPTSDARLLISGASSLENKLSEYIMGITAWELVESKEEGADFFLLDIRSEAEWKKGHIPGAANIPLADLNPRLGEVPRFTTLVIYGRLSNQAYQAACFLRGLGAKHVYVLDGGYLLWPFEIETGKK